MRIILKPAGAFLVLGTLSCLAFTAVRFKIAAAEATRTAAAAPLRVAPAPVPSAASSLLKNGAMSEGTLLPLGWDTEWTGKGKIAVARDTSIFHDAPAALRLESVGGSAEGQIAQMVPGKSGEKLLLKGFARSQGKVTVHVAIQPYKELGAPINFQVVRQLGGEQDWAPFEREIVLPEGTTVYGVVLFLTGEGKAWLDEVTVTSVPTATR